MGSIAASVPIHDVFALVTVPAHFSNIANL
jgi:hypothetical protein